MHLHMLLPEKPTIHRKSPVSVSFLIKLQASSLHFSKKETLTQCFPVNFVKFLRTPFLQNTSRPLFLYSPTYFVNFHVFSWKCFLCLLILRKLFQMQSSLTKIFNFTSSEWYYLFLLQKFMCHYCYKWKKAFM